MQTKNIFKQIVRDKYHSKGLNKIPKHEQYAQKRD